MTELMTKIFDPKTVSLETIGDTPSGGDLSVGGVSGQQGSFL